ncbi:hypothetical protein V2H21_01260 [Riemerella anatipestifer]|uniref:hypothetical protein n=1 Tax=Riemerella anatipestifer TaxID=34085 RepID=UPI002A8E3EF2|nr:hypothetical protein [Riemerella anatipestifer]MEE3723995.1 hypothetical protein [Riemerella anatipestifer]
MTTTEQIQAEKKELDLLTGKGFEIEVASFFGKKRKFQAKKMALGRMLRLSKIFITMELNDEALNSKDFQEQLSAQYQAVLQNARKVAKVIAVCVTDNKLLSWWIQRQVLKSYTSKEILNFAQTLLKEADYANFILSIALLNGNRPTKANPIEK